VLPLEAFNRRTASPDGRMARCRRCDSEYKKAHRKKYPERHREQDRKRYQGERRDRILAQTRARYEADPEAWKAALRERYWRDVEATRRKSRAYRKINAARVKEWKRREYDRHGEKIRAKRKRDYAADPEKFLQRTLAYQRANPQWANERNGRYRARKRSATIGKVTVELLAAKAACWGERCWMCGGEWTDWDHVKPLAKGGPHMLANLRPACDPCNSSKGDRWPLPKALLAGRRSAGVEYRP
jgi:5-methylcytosine-specific restriction endonuclease McrA